MKQTADFIIQVNEIYHDVEANVYRSRHPEIFTDEINRWREIGKRFIAESSHRVALLDIGSGTGFVPCEIGGFLKRNDLCVCSDISSNMLDSCKKNLSDKGFKCEFMYLKLEGMRIGLKSGFFTHITLNSVLHHIPDFSPFFKEIDRLLQIQGWLIIGHEPNRHFYTHKLLWKNYRACCILMNPKSYISDKLRNSRLFSTSNKTCKNHNVANLKRALFFDEVNKRLLKVGIVEDALTPNQISEIVDIHSPTAGGFHKERGINISQLLERYLSNYQLKYFETYNHLGQISSRNTFTRCYDSFLKRFFPMEGATFLAVLKKVSSSL